MTKQSIIEELKREQKMRIKVWKANHADGKPFFTNMTQQQQYDKMDAAIKVLQSIPDHYFNKQEDQATLF